MHVYKFTNNRSLLDHQGEHGMRGTPNTSKNDPHDQNPDLQSSDLVSVAITTPTCPHINYVVICKYWNEKAFRNCTKRSNCKHSFMHHQYNTSSPNFFFSKYYQNCFTRIAFRRSGSYAKHSYPYLLNSCGTLRKVELITL